MKRREFVKSLGAGSLALGAAVAGAPAVHAQEQIKWKMVTTWPKNFPGLGTGANNLARLVNEMSGGRIEVKVYGAKELVGALEIFDAVSRGTAEMGHGASYYWKGKSEAAQFFAAVPFGLNAQEMNGWLYHGGGMELWQEVYAPFGLVPTAAGNTGVQMGGWFNKEINSVDDLKGLKMRIPGLGGEVLKRAGGTPVLLPGGEIRAQDLFLGVCVHIFRHAEGQRGAGVEVPDLGGAELDRVPDPLGEVHPARPGKDDVREDQVREALPEMYFPHTSELWGPIWGYVALEEDLNTISGAVFDHQGETPGLGAEINTDWFQEPFTGKTIFNEA